MIPWASDIHNCHVLGSPSLSGGQKNSFIYPTKAGHLHYNVVLKSKFHHRSALLLIAVFQISLFALLLISAKRRQMLSLIFYSRKETLYASTTSLSPAAVFYRQRRPRAGYSRRQPIRPTRRPTTWQHAIQKSIHKIMPLNVSQSLTSLGTCGALNFHSILLQKFWYGRNK